jgi:hypothetical protein
MLLENHAGPAAMRLKIPSRRQASDILNRDAAACRGYQTVQGAQQSRLSRSRCAKEDREGSWLKPERAWL